MKIKQKIVFSNVISIIIISIITSFGIITFSDIHNKLIEVDKEKLPLVRVIEELRFTGLLIVASTSEYSLLNGESNRSWITVASNSENYEEGQVKAGIAHFNNALNRYEALAAKHLPGKQVQTNNIRHLGEDLIDISTNIIHAKKEGIHGKEILDLKEQFEYMEIALLRTTNDVRLHAERILKSTNDNIHYEISRAIKILLITVLLALAILLMAGLLLSRSITVTNQINDDGSERIFEVNLNTTADMETKNEIDHSATSENKTNEDVSNNTSPLT